MFHRGMKVYRLPDKTACKNYQEADKLVCNYTLYVRGIEVSSSVIVAVWKRWLDLVYDIVYVCLSR